MSLQIELSRLCQGGGVCYNPMCQSGGCIAVFSDNDRPSGVSGGAFAVEPEARPDEVQAHVDAVLSDLAQDKLKPQQIEQVQHAATDAALRRAVRGGR